MVWLVFLDVGFLLCLCNKEITCVHSLIVMSIIKRQAVITEKYGAHGCNVGEDGGFAPNISRQV
jgi:hypothetical protein